MSSDESLGPPPQGTEDPGARQLSEPSDSEDSFTDALSGRGDSDASSSPIPKTRVERVDDVPSHGEVPGTEAHEKRINDAEPDEMTIVPDPEARSKTSIPTTVVEEAPGDTGSHSEEHHIKRAADAEPDVLVKAGSDGAEGSENAQIDPQISAPPSAPNVSISPPAEDEGAEVEDDEDDDDFGDDFDDFEEGAENDEFDDFEHGFQQPPTTFPAYQPPMTLPFPLPEFAGLSQEDILASTEPLLVHLFPPEELDFPELPPLSKDSSVFLTSRSASLWSQLIAPPPLAPPDWIRSRTRRLFLVSLGVPVDLDEILPASKQKKLVLPSLNLPSHSPRNSSDSRSVSRLRQGDGNGSSTSVDTQGKPSSSSKRKKGYPAPPELDMVVAKHACMITEEALNGMTDEELKAHVEKLKGYEETAQKVLEYWQKRTDEKIGDREAFEGVIENLVKHARKVRK